MRVESIPIASLEEYGIDQRTINALEVRYGLYMGPLLTTTREDLLRTKWINEGMVERIAEAAAELVDDVCWRMKHGLVAVEE